MPSELTATRRTVVSRTTSHGNIADHVINSATVGGRQNALSFIAVNVGNPAFRCQYSR